MLEVFFAGVALPYQVEAKRAVMVTAPLNVIVAAAFLAALPTVSRAVRIDPVEMLRSE